MCPVAPITTTRPTQAGYSGRVSVDRLGTVPDPPQPTHDLFAAATEEIVQAQVLAVQDVVGTSVLGSRLVARVTQRCHPARRVGDRGVTAGGRARGDCSPHRGAERG